MQDAAWEACKLKGQRGSPGHRSHPPAGVKVAPGCPGLAAGAGAYLPAAVEAAKVYHPGQSVDAAPVWVSRCRVVPPHLAAEHSPQFLRTIPRLGQVTNPHLGLKPVVLGAAAWLAGLVPGPQPREPQGLPGLPGV